jgi:hypothetical protein
MTPWLWLPSFPLACALSLLGAALFVVWIFLDCSFPQTASIVGQDLRLRFLRDPGVRYEHRWEYFGPRVLAFAVLACLSLAATLAVAIRLVESDRGRSLWAILLAAGLAAVWIAILASYRRLRWKAFCRRIFRFQGAMEAAAAVLLEHWPEKEVILPGLGTYTVADRDRDLLFRDGPGFLLGVREIVGERIARTESGDLRFDVGSDPQWWVEHRRENRVPPESSARYMPPHTVTWRRQYWAEYAPGWHLTCYAVSIERTDELGPEIAAEIARRPAGMRLPHQGGRFRASSDVDVEIVVWEYAPYLPYPDYGLPVVARPRKAGLTAIPMEFRTCLLPKGAVLRLHYEPDTSQSTHCHVVPERYAELEQQFVDAKSRGDRDYSNYSVFLSYLQLDKDFEWLEADR